MLFHETVSKEPKNDVTARAQAVAEMAEMAAKAKREAEALERRLMEERRTFETEFGHAPEQTNDDEEEQTKRARILRGINRYIGNDAADEENSSPPPLTFKVFTRLNAPTPTPVTRERYHPRAPVTIKTLRDLKKKRDGSALAPGEWDAYKQRIKARCEMAGRIMSFNDFCKQNGDQARGGTKSELWKQYNESWDALCGIVLKRVSTDRIRQKKTTPSKKSDENAPETSNEEEEEDEEASPTP